jgi:hypothetical protein
VEPGLEFLPDSVSREQAGGEPGDSQAADDAAARPKKKSTQPAAKPASPKKQSPADVTPGAPPADVPPVELPDFLKELGLDSKPSERGKKQDDALPPVETSDDLLPLRPDSDR